PGPHQPGFPRPGGAALHAQPGRTAVAGQEQPRRLVDFAAHLRGAGGHAHAAHFHRRGIAFGPGHARKSRMSASPAPVLSLRGLSVDFGDGPVVDALDLDILEGERFALVGESGSGKTVTALSVLKLNPN